MKQSVRRLVFAAEGPGKTEIDRKGHASSEANDVVVAKHQVFIDLKVDAAAGMPALSQFELAGEGLAKIMPIVITIKKEL